jgi:hypothetical protein
MATRTFTNPITLNIKLSTHAEAILGIAMGQALTYVLINPVFSAWFAKRPLAGATIGLCFSIYNTVSSYAKANGSVQLPPIPEPPIADKDIEKIVSEHGLDV